MRWSVFVVLSSAAYYGASAHGAISWSGDLDPADPLTWTNTTSASIGKTSEGWLSIAGGDAVSSRFGYIGNETGSTGSVTVDGAGSLWSNGAALEIGHQGTGTLAVTGGGSVWDGSSGYIGGDAGGTGRVVVDGVGSEWVNDANVFVGNYGEGLLVISGGGHVQASYGAYVARFSGSSGEIHFADGSLSTGRLLCAIDDLTGEGTIYTHGLVSDVDLVFDAAHGLNQTLVLDKNPGQNLTLFLNVDGSGYLGAGYSGAAQTLITDGVTVESESGSIGWHEGSRGTVTVDGVGSTWNNKIGVHVGLYGDGTLNITGGGVVTSGVGFLGYPGTGRVLVDGDGSAWMNRESLYIGQFGTGTLKITGGGRVNNDAGLLGATPGGTGHVAVEGSGSTWINESRLEVGLEGAGFMTIAGGGAVRNLDEGYIGRLRDSRGRVTVEGAGSSWTNCSSLVVGRNGVGTLEITRRGLVKVDGSMGIDIVNSGESSVDMATGGMLALRGEAHGSLQDFLGLVEGAGLVRYWNNSLAEWAPITEARYGEEYTLRYFTEGDLAGFTVLAVGAIPEPSSFLLQTVFALAVARRRLFAQDSRR
ncbi:MAG: hypothetical protein KDA37_15300 [Planctomycetales bacterium]|nr:hypothetical protein [Planctomycetales bacterium]